MGAVRRLATVVIIGLVAISTTMVVYLAAEPDRRSDETETQDVVAIERGTELYITYCLQCHGPAGLGAVAAEEPRRIGAVLDQAPVYGSVDDMKELLAEGKLHAIFQSDDPVLQSAAEDWLRFRITYGVPAEPYQTAKLMPAFGADFNVEEMNDIIYLIMHGDWNYVYNTAVLQTGQQVATQECAQNPDGQYCKDISKAPPAYPTVPAAAPANDEEATPASADSGDTADADDAAASIAAQDISFSTDQLTLKPGDTVSFTNNGMLEHDFVVDELGIEEVLGAGESTTFTIPEDAQPGDYKFYCSIPGHEASGMFGTLTIEG
ncbi:MAG TPA: plastocyanin/azurin family copper-binding protein [Thermomicrobiales bacterium]|nr:plastocyanin/azurin family copper-binding protein [Thermomicrobiales bacterium]